MHLNRIGVFEDVVGEFVILAPLPQRVIPGPSSGFRTLMTTPWTRRPPPRRRARAAADADDVERYHGGGGSGFARRWTRRRSPWRPDA